MAFGGPRPGNSINTVVVEGRRENLINTLALEGQAWKPYNYNYFTQLFLAHGQETIPIQRLYVRRQQMRIQYVKYVNIALSLSVYIFVYICIYIHIYICHVYMSYMHIHWLNNSEYNGFGRPTPGNPVNTMVLEGHDLGNL